MVVQFSGELLDEFTSPRITNFSYAELVSLSEASQNSSMWMLRFAIGDVLGRKLKPLHGRAFRHFARRASAALRCYEEMRLVLERYFLGHVSDSPQLGLYFRALDAGEQAILQCQIALECLGRSGSVSGVSYQDCPKAVREIANTLKHFGERLNRGTTGEQILPVWFENDAICSNGHRFTFRELSDLLEEMTVTVEAMIGA